jgi:hypothetical protein
VAESARSRAGVEARALQKVGGPVKGPSSSNLRGSPSNPPRTGPGESSHRHVLLHKSGLRFVAMLLATKVKARFRELILRQNVRLGRLFASCDSTSHGFRSKSLKIWSKEGALGGASFHAPSYVEESLKTWAAFDFARLLPVREQVPG